MKSKAFDNLIIITYIESCVEIYGYEVIISDRKWLQKLIVFNFGQTIPTEILSVVIRDYAPLPF
jgi:hypothetical protein